MIRTLLFAALLLSPLGLRSHPGVGIVETSRGAIYYTDLKHVWKISSDGTKSIAVSNVHTHELYLDENDNLFGEHLWYNGETLNTWGYYVWKLSAAGKLEKVIPDTEGYRENYSFVRDHFGHMFWPNRENPCQTLIRSDANGRTSRLGTGCFENVRWMHVMADGSVALVDFQDVKKVDKDGRVTVVGQKVANKSWTKSTRENQNSVYGIWSDKAGSLYTAVSSERLVKKFSADGKESTAFKTSFPWSPSGGVVDAQGRLWILEYNVVNGVRVERVNADGSTTTF